MTVLGKCEFCDGDVHDGFAAFPVTGWEAQRKDFEKKTKGGQNHVLLRKRVPGRVAHISCVRREVANAKHGIGPDQLGLGA